MKTFDFQEPFATEKSYSQTQETKTKLSCPRSSILEKGTHFVKNIRRLLEFVPSDWLLCSVIVVGKFGVAIEVEDPFPWPLPMFTKLCGLSNLLNLLRIVILNKNLCCNKWRMIIRYKLIELNYYHQFILWN